MRIMLYLPGLTYSSLFFIAFMNEIIYSFICPFYYLSPSTGVEALWEDWLLLLLDPPTLDQSSLGREAQQTLLCEYICPGMNLHNFSSDLWYLPESMYDALSLHVNDELSEIRVYHPQNSQHRVFA